MDGAAPCQRLDRYERGNKKAFSTVRIPTVDGERERAMSRQRQQFMRERQRFAGMGRVPIAPQHPRHKEVVRAPRRYCARCESRAEGILSILTLAMRSRLNQTDGGSSRDCKAQLPDPVPEPVLNPETTVKLKPIHLIMKYVPMISSALAGPIGVLHLPRLWQKASLEAQGKLHQDYPGIGKGYDSMVLAALHLEEAAVRAFIQTKPTYPQFEAWIKQQPGVKLDKATIYKNNAAILGYIHTDATRHAILEANGLPDDGSVNPGAVDLNNLDDWSAFHKEVLS